MIQVFRRWSIAMAARLGYSGSGGASGEINITLRESALIGDSRVRLADVASISAATRRQADALGSLDLGPAPWPGDRLLLRQSALAAHVRRQHRMRDGAPVKWAGPRSVWVERGVRQVDSGAIQAIAERALNVWLNRQTVVRHQVSVLAPPLSAQVAAGPLTMAAVGLSERQVPAGIITVWVELQVDGWVARRIPVVLFVRAFVQRWVARTDLPRATVVDDRGFEPCEVELMVPDRIASAELPLGARLVRPLRAGVVLEPCHVVEAYDVARGDVVTADLRMGPLNVQARAEALQDGRHGQEVQVRIAGAASSVSAQVIGPGRVQVTE